MYFQILFFIISLGSVCTSFYDILGVSRSATDIDIKQAYKKLARKWHPDKNRAPEASEYFTKITEAYEALSNPDKRKEYDAFGSISNEPRGHEGQGHFWNGGPFGNAYFDFGQNDNSESHFESTNFRHYKMDILPNSFKQPTLILLVSHFCFSCHHATRLWGNIADQITESGIRVTISDLIADGHLREELRVQHVPTVVMIIDGQVKYMQSEINKETVIDFIRYSFPKDLIQRVQSEEELNYFHNSWLKDSRSKMIMTKPLDRPSFRYLSIAFKYRSEISAAFMQLDEDDSYLEKIIDSYQLKKNEETVIVFHDEKTFYTNNVILPKVVDRHSRSRLSLHDIDYLVKSNYHLPFPRLLSQSIFDLACPPPSQKQRSFGFCVITIVHSKHKNNLSQSDSWQYVRSMIGDQKHAKIMYLFGDIQYDFLRSLKLVDPAKSSVDMFMDQVILLWRQSYTSATSLFLSNPWQYSNIEMVLNNWDLLSNFDSAISILKTRNQIQNTITDSDNLSELIDELEAPLWLKICTRFFIYVRFTFIFLYEFLTEPFNLIIAILGIVLLSYVYSTVKAVSAHLSQESNDKPCHEEPKPNNSYTFHSPSVTVPQFNNDSYSSLLRNHQSGRLICVLLITEDTSRDILLLLEESITKLKCHGRLSPFTLALGSHPFWLKALLGYIKEEDDRKNVLSSISSLSVNRPYSSEGIVLALNISRCYFSICPLNLLQHSPSYIGSDGSVQRRKVHYRIPSYDSTDTDTSDSCASDIDYVSDAKLSFDIRSRFFDWLCQLMEGVCPRYQVSEWPSKL